MSFVSAVERLVGVARSMAVGEPFSRPQLDEEDCLPLPPLWYKEGDLGFGVWGRGECSRVFMKLMEVDGGGAVFGRLWM